MPKKSLSVPLVTAQYVFNMHCNTESIYRDTVLAVDTQPNQIPPKLAFLLFFCPYSVILRLLHCNVTGRFNIGIHTLFHYIIIYQSKH